MKKVVLKLARVFVAAAMVIGTATMLNAQPNPNNNGGGGIGGLTDGGGVGDGSTQVPLDPNMTLLFAGVAILFFAYKYKKGQLSILG